MNRSDARRSCPAVMVLPVVLVVTLWMAARPAVAGGDEGRSASPYFVVQGAGDITDVFPLKSTNVVAYVNGVIADVYVTQTYSNDGATPLHARYVFPGSTRAAIHGMKIKVGSQAVVAKIRERRQARQEFETARAAGKSASLLEQQRPNVFTMEVANILPADQVEVELHYSELLVPEEGIYQFVYPTVVAPRYSNGAEAAVIPAAAIPSAIPPQESRIPAGPSRLGAAPGSGRFEIHVTLSTGIPVRDVRSSSHEVSVTYDAPSVARVALADPLGLGGDRDFILDYRLTGGVIQSGLLLYKGESENFFLLTVQPPERVAPAQVPPREYVFILDVSGSMDGFPRETSEALVSELISGLRPTDVFNVILFAGGSQVLAPSSLPATPANLDKARRMIDSEPSGGGTEILPALRAALALPRDERYARSVVVITDGFVSVEPEVFSLIRVNLDRTNVFAFGIGSSVNRYLIEGMARAGQGEPFIVTKPEEAAGAARRFVRYVSSPVLTNARVAFRGFDAYDVEPIAPPDLFAGRPIVVFGKWRGGAAGEIELTGQAGAGRWARTLRVSESRPLVENSALRYLWARTKLARLSDFAGDHEDQETAAAITSLGLTYSLLTKHTSFVAVLETIRDTGTEARNVDQPLALPQGMRDLSAGGVYASGPEPELWILVAIAAGMALVWSARRRDEHDVPGGA